MLKLHQITFIVFYRESIFLRGKHNDICLNIISECEGGSPVIQHRNKLTATIGLVVHAAGKLYFKSLVELHLGI